MDEELANLIVYQASYAAAARVVSVGGGACWNDVDAPTQSFGLAMPGGTYGDTGVAGLTLTGGIGHLIGSFGLTLDNLRRATVVTAGGDIVRASADENPDLFWALRGGGGNFGVVTEFVFELHEVLLMTGGFLIHRIDDAAEALRAFARMRDQMPDELTVMPQLVPEAGLIPDAPVLLTSVAFLGSVDDAADAIAPLRSPAPIFDNVGPAFYSQLQGLYAYMPFGLRNYWTGRFVQEMPGDLIDFIVDHFVSGPRGTYSAVLFEPMHGAPTRIGPEETAFAFRHARFNVSPMAIWDDPALDDDAIAWAQEARDRLQPLSRGGYLNYATDDAADTVEGAFGAETYARLRAVKTAWDPDNLFRFNHNVPPAP